MTFSSIIFRVLIPKRDHLGWTGTSTDRIVRLGCLLAGSETASNLGFHQASLFKVSNGVITSGHRHGVL